MSIRSATILSVSGLAILVSDARAASPCDDPARMRELSTVTMERSTLAPGESRCFRLILAQGELARIVISVSRGYVRARILSPGGTELQRTWTSSFSFAAPSPTLTIEAPSSGGYLVELATPTWVNFTETQSFSIHVGSRESAAVRAARRDQLRRDPRVAWLRSHAIPLRNPETADDDVSDLEFLRDVVGDTRVVFLGEGDNGGGSDILVKTRLVKFLHERMGFDVLAFQTGIYSGASAWQAIRRGTSTRAAFESIMPRLLMTSAQAQSLVQHVTMAAKTARPLELTGFDSQFAGAASRDFLPALRTFLQATLPDAILLDTTAFATRLLSEALGGASGTSLVSPADQAEAIVTLRREADRIASQGMDPETLLRAQSLRSAAGQLALLLDNRRGASASETLASLARQQAENLIWLAESRYANRKIIVWSHTFHALRSHDATSHGRRTGTTVGEAVSRAIGPKVFTIGLTSYEGSSYFVTQPDDYFQSVIPDQHPGDAFETLMAAAGHETAFVNLRDARSRNAWLGGRFIANALYLVPEEADWSSALDAILFIRTQQPRRRNP